MSEQATIRKTDSPFNDPVQSCRFVEMENKWFFMTREKTVQGPYATRNSAAVALEIYLSELAISGIESGHGKIQPGKQPFSTGYHVEELKNVIRGPRAFGQEWRD